MIVQNSVAGARRRGHRPTVPQSDRLMAHMDDVTREALDQGPWTTLEIRYLRKAVRYRLVGSGLGSRRTPPSGNNTTQGITLERRRTSTWWPTGCAGGVLMISVARHEPNARRALDALIEEWRRLAKTYSVSGMAKRAILTRDINQLADALHEPRPPAPQAGRSPPKPGKVRA